MKLLSVDDAIAQAAAELQKAALGTRYAATVHSVTDRETTGWVICDVFFRDPAADGRVTVRVNATVDLAADDLIYIRHDPAGQKTFVFDGFVKGGGTGNNDAGAFIPWTQAPGATSPVGMDYNITPATGQDVIVDGVNWSTFGALQFVLMAADAAVANERVLTGGDGISLTDGGAGGAATLAVDLVAAWSGLEFAAGEMRVDLDANFDLLGTITVRDFAFGGATGTNVITIPDAVADALQIVDGTTGDEYLGFDTTAQKEIVANEDGVDIDYRIEAVGQTHALFVQGSDSRVGIGAAAPVRELHVGDGTDALVQAYAGITANVAGVAQVSARNSTDNVEVGMFAHEDRGYIGTWTNHELRFKVSNADVMTLLESGNVGVGTVTPAHLLDVRGNIGMVCGVANTDRYVYFASDAYIMWDESDDIFLFPKAARVIAVQPNMDLTWTATDSYSRFRFIENAATYGTIQSMGSTFVVAARQRNMEFFSVQDITFWPSNTDSFNMTAAAFYPTAVKATDLGLATNEWDNIYYVTVNVGTSRLVRATRDCPVCGTELSRGTGTTIYRGEKADYAMCFCLNCGNAAVEELNHLSPDKEAEKLPAPKIVLESVRIKSAGRNRSIAIDFRYGDDLIEDDLMMERAIRNSTRLGEYEVDEFLAMSDSERRAFLLILGEREWASREESRLMQEEAKLLRVTVNAKVKNWIGTDLLEMEK